MIIVYATAALRTVNQVLERSVIPAVRGHRKAREMSPRDCGALGTLALTDQEFEELRSRTNGARRLHEFAEEAGLAPPKRKKEEA